MVQSLVFLIVADSYVVIIRGAISLHIIAGVYILESLLIFFPPPDFDFLPRDASRRIFISMIFFPI